MSYVIQNPDDLRLFAGEILEVMQKNDHGWWYGIANRNGTLHKGYFPKNYVKPVVISNIPKPPPRPSKTLEPPVSEQKNVTKLTEQVSKMTVSRGPSFSLKSCSAFDDLMEFGYAVEIIEDSNKGNDKVIGKGARVELKCRAEIWDGASTLTKEFANGNVNFVTGENQITSGLDAGVQKLSTGQKATITCAPAMAYGSAGNPPAVPPNSFVVFHVEVLSVKSAEGSMDPGSTSGGTQVLLGSSGVSATRKVKGALENRRDSRFVLLDTDNTTTTTSTTSAAAPTKPSKPTKSTEASQQESAAAEPTSPDGLVLNDDIHDA